MQSTVHMSEFRIQDRAFCHFKNSSVIKMFEVNPCGCNQRSTRLNVLNVKTLFTILLNFKKCTGNKSQMDVFGIFSQCSILESRENCTKLATLKRQIYTVIYILLHLPLPKAWLYPLALSITSGALYHRVATYLQI